MYVKVFYRKWKGYQKPQYSIRLLEVPLNVPNKRTNFLGNCRVAGENVDLIRSLSPMISINDGIAQAGETV